MAKQLNVNLAFTADTSQAKAQIQSLQQTLMNLTTATSLPGATKITSDLVSAKNAAGQLKIALQQATNVQTGNLDLTKFNAQLQKGSKDLNYYAQQLAKLGPQGVQAFGELTQSIMSAEIPLQRTRGLLSEFATTLKNTVRWQFASSALMGITSAVSTAYNYAEKLNSSLNDIRIVSGLSAEEMDKFAKRANEAAQSLSTTTTKYTDAALIFYQQGLSDSEVEERTNATIKMANVTGEAVDDVSSYMTAVWNNFNKDGTESVEHFADVMTKLGADTAASTEEIAGGLEKFAGVCDTIGLSFDYATSAITTIVDRTRQSEDVVGTALKTIFSRVQGLQLGETLDDGTTLNQYSTALAKIGVGIKTLDGELRPMDDILDDIGEKWEKLNDAEKAAVAQKVAGIRQYNQFIALFDNWDFMKQNLATASAADGTLNEQAEIYAESWEGARNRVQAAAQQIYAALIDDDFFISLNNGFADVLGVLGDFIENLGGVKTILPMIASALLVAFGPNIAGLIDELDYRIKRMNGTLAQEALATQKAAAEKNEELSKLSIGTAADQAQAKNTAIRLNLQEQILSNTKILGEEKANQYIQELDILKILQDQTVELQKQADKADQSVKDRKDQVTSQVYTNAGDLTAEQAGRLDTYFADADYQLEQVDAADAKINQIIQERKDKHAEIEAEKARKLEEAKKTAKDNNDTSFDEEAYTKQLNQEAGTKKAAVSNEMKGKLADVADEYGNNLSESVLSQLRNEEGKSAQELEDFWDANSKTGWVKNSGKQKAKQDLTEKFENEGFEASEKSINNYIEKSNEALEKRKIASQAAGQTEAQVKQTEEDIKKSISDGNTKLMTRGEVMTGIASGVMGISAGISSLQGLVQTLNDESTSNSEKLLSFLTIAPMAMSEFMMGWSSLSTAVKGGTAALTAYNAAVAAGTVSEKKGIIVKALASAQQRGNNFINWVANKLKAKGIVLTEAQTAANTGLIASLGPILIGLLPIIGALGALATAIYLVYKHQHKAREAYEQSTETLSTVQSAYNDVKSSIESTNTALDNLSDKYKNLKELTYGTSEWRDALAEVNDEVQGIIEKYDLKADEGDWYRDDQGILHLTKDGKDKIKEENERQERSAQIAYNAAKADNEDKAVAAGLEEIQYESEYGNTTSSEYRTHNESYGTENLSEEAAQKAMKAIAKYNITTIGDGGLNEEFLQKYTTLTDKEIELITSNDKLGEKLIDLSDAVQDNTEAQIQRTANELASDEEFSAAVDKNIEEGYQAGVYEYAGEELNNKVESRLEDWKNNSNTTETLTDKDREAYFKDIGYGYDENDKTYYKLSDDGVSLDKDQELTDEKQSDDAIFRWKAKNEEIEKASDNIDHYTDVVEESKKVWASVDKTKDSWKNISKEVKNASKTYGDNEKELKNWVKNSGKNLTSFVSDHKDDLKTIFVSENDKSFGEIFDNLDDGQLSEFITENATLFQKAMDGDEEAVNELRDKLQDVMAEDWESNLFGDDGKITYTPMVDFSDAAKTVTQDQMTTLMQDLKDAIEPLEIGASLDTTEVKDALKELTVQAGMSADELTEFLSLSGFEGVELEPTYQTVEMTWWDKVKAAFGSEGSSDGTEVYNPTTKKKKVFTGFTVKGNRTSNTSTGNNIIGETDDTNNDDNVDTSTGSGSGSKKTSSAKKVDSKIVRYHNIDDTLEDINQKLEKAADLEDRLFGNARITQMDKQIKAYKEEVAALEKRNKIAKNYLKDDKKKATKSINKFNKLTGAKVSDVKYDSDNDILNYNAILSAAKKAADKWYKKAKANPEDDAIQDKYDKIKEYYEDIEEKLKQVEDTRDQIVENEEKRLEALRNAQDKYFDELTYKVEVKLDINERDLELLERSYDKIADLTYKRAEAIKILFKTEKDAEGKDVLTSDSRFGVAAKQLGIYTDEYNELKKAYSAGNISQEQFVEGLEDVYEGALDAADTLQDLDEQMLEYYSDTLSSGAEELDKYAERIDNVVSGLNHYLTVMDLIGKNKSYAQINKITSTLTKTAKNQYNTATQTYKMYLDQQTQAKQAMDDYLKKHTELATYEQQMNDAGYQALLKNYDAITEYVDDAYEDQLSSAEEYLEALNTEYTNFFDQLKNNYLDTLSSTMDFDRLNNSLQNVKTQWEEVLTPVNQAYELTKLIRQAEQDMADTDSAYAKQQYQEYIDSTKALEDKTELSNYELEIQQAKYKQLQAQIALEEAQNAKNMVRLSRDSEGNYGYVYTADQDSIADAQQAKDDADNDLYNIALRGRDEYYEKLLQLESDYQDAIAEAGETYKDDTEKLNEALAEIEAEYYNIRQTYLYNYNLAAITDDRAKRDAYVANYEDVIKKDDEWKTTSTENINAIKEKQQEYKDSTEEVYNALGLSVGEFTSTIENLDEKQQSLTTTVQTKVIPALEDEETQVLNTATAYAQYRTEVEKTIKQLEDLAKVADTTISQVGGYTEEGEEESSYNTFINNLAIKRGLYTSKDSKGIVHFSKTDQDTADKYAKNANVSSETEKWNNSVAKNMMDKNGWFAYDSEGKIHFTTKTDTKEAKAYLAKLMGMKESEFTMNKFDTGGYTGSWGNSGKLALLHEKELVLNADDTKNFLAGINILRDVVKSIDLQAMCASNSGMRAAGVSTSNQTLAQEVNITAEFPNATDHSEIEQAFDTLINRAAQYVNRK